MVSLPRVTPQDVARFWGNVRKSDDPNQCWLWTSYKYPSGYGKFNLRAVPYAAHRFSYLLAHGSIPDDLCICHSCDVRDCVNPRHLWVGTRADNNEDKEIKGRANHACGVRNGSYLHPESRIRGEQIYAAKLTSAQVIEIRARYANGGVTYKQLGQQYRVRTQQIYNIVRGRAWRHLLP